jgi:PAS domain S-box-containing protein
MRIDSVKPGGLAEFLEEQDIVSLIRLNLVLSTLVGIVALIGFMTFRDSGWAHFARNGLLMIAASLFLIFLLNKGQVALAVYLALLIYGGIFTYAAWTGAGVQGTTYTLFFLLVVGAALVIGRRAGYVTALIAVALGLVLLVAARAGLLPNLNRPALDIVNWVTLSFGFFVAAHIVSLVIRQAERAIAAAQSELAERTRAEAEVRRLNSELEGRVRERTSQLAAREAFLSGILDGAGDAIITMDETHQILSFSKSAERIFGYTASEIVGQPLDVLLPPLLIQAHRQHIQNFEQSSDASRFMGSRREVYGRRKDGTEFPAQASISKITVDDKLIFSAFLWDISERRQLELALREKEERFRRLFEISPVAIVVTTLAEGRLLEANEAYWKMSGHDPGTSIGKTTLELRAGYEARQRQDFVAELMAKKSIRHPNYVFVDEAGNLRPTMAFYELIDLNGQPTILSMFYDMTEQVEAQNALQRSAEHVRGLLNAVPDTIFELRRDGLVLQYIPAADSAAKEPSEAFVGKSIEQIMPASVAGQVMFAVERALESGLLHVIEYQLRQASQEKTYEARVAVNGEDRTLMIVRDVSLHKWLEAERDRMIEELEQRNAESESLRETTVIVTSTLDISEAVQRILQQLKRVIAYDSASVWLYQGNTAHMVGGDGIPDIPEEDRHYIVGEADPDFPLWSEKLPYILLDDVQAGYAQFREPPINYIHGWLSIPLRVRGELTGFISLDSKAAGQFTDEDARLALNYANQVSVALENARLFTDLQNELNERQKLIHELDAKNSELERFTYAVSHDLRSPLITIKGFLGFLREDVAAGDAARVQSDLQRIDSATGVMKQRLDDLLELSRVGRLTDRSELIGFNALVNEALELVHGRISQRGVMVQVEENLPAVVGNHHRLLEVVQNLLDNAAKFMGDQSHPLIEIGQRGEEAGKPIFFVKDNGLGIPPEHHEKIFGIFNKLDPKAEGTGIGLSLVRKIVEVHGGRIWVESQVGKGSTFYFTLPCK